MAVRIITLKCESCGAALELTVSKDFAFCPYCGTKILLKDESIRINKEDAKEAGYAFEQGRKRVEQELNERRRAIQDRVPYHTGRTGTGQNPILDQPQVNSLLEKSGLKSILDKPEVRSVLDMPEVKSIFGKFRKK